jgi:uncharacterized membrane protein (UPF0127 family)
LFTKISSRDLRKTTVFIKNRIIICEVPETSSEQAKGLKERTILFEHQGMLFDTGSRYQPLFTMRDVRIDLEAVFVGNDYTIKDIVPMRKMDASTAYTTPLRIPIRYVIELNKGYCARYGLKAGDKVRIT